MTKELLYYFEGLDESILKINDYIIDSGFEFVKYDLNKFIKKFKDLIPSVKGYGYNEIIPALGITYANNFGLERLKYLNHGEITEDKYVVLLNYENVVPNYNEIIDEADKLVTELMKKMKLFKTGHFKLLSSFMVDEYGITPSSYSLPSKDKTYLKYSLKDIDLSHLKYFKDQLRIPSYLELSFDAFLEYYNIEDDEIKFVLLMIVLESIFNPHTGIRVTHTISRHAAVVLTLKTDKNPEDIRKKAFDDYFNKVIKLYKIRSMIVHGEKKDSREYEETIRNNTHCLEKIVRKVLQNLIWLHDFGLNRPEHRQELFDYLNRRGFAG